MSKFFKTITFYILLIFGCSNIFSQSNQNEFETILRAIEEKYEVSFSYTDNTLKNLDISYDQVREEIYKLDTLEHVLAYLETTTKLTFNRLKGDQFITIRPNNRKTELPILQKLEAVYIENYLTAGIAKNSAGGITITPQKFGILPGLIEPDILQTIQALPGVLSVNEDVSNISIRGGTPDQNLMLYDGIRMYQSGHFFGLISAFNPYLTKKVAVYRHGTKAQYGDGVSSVVNMSLADENPPELKVGAGVNFISADGFAEIPLSKKTALQVAGRRSITDFVNTPTYDQYFDNVFQDSDLTAKEDAVVTKNENFYFYDTALKFLYNPSDKDKIRFNFLNIYNSLNYEETSTIATARQESESKLEQKSLGLGLSYSRQWNSKLNTLVQLYYSTYELEGTNFNILQNQRLIQENKVLDDGLKFALNYNFNDYLSVHTGLQFSQVAVSNFEDLNNPSFRNLLKNVVRTTASYVEAEYHSKTENTVARIGIRHNYLDKFNVHLLEPRLYLSQRFLEHFRIAISGELKSQSTSQIIDLQKDFLGIQKRRWVVTDNDRIPIIKSQQATVGLTYNQNNLLISAEAFVKNVSGITTRSQGFQNQFQFVYSIGDYQIKGIDFLFNKQFSDFSTWLSYSVSKNEYDFENLNDNFLFPNNFDVSHVVNFSSAYTIRNLKLALGVNWHSAKPVTLPENRTPIVNSTINYQRPNSRRLPDYIRTDFSGTYQFKLGRHKALIGVSVWNILNQKNITNTYYELENDQVVQVDNQSLKITPNLSFRVSF